MPRPDVPKVEASGDTEVVANKQNSDKGLSMEVLGVTLQSESKGHSLGLQTMPDF